MSVRQVYGIVNSNLFFSMAMHGTFRRFVCPVVCGLVCPGAFWTLAGRCLSGVLLAVPVGVVDMVHVSVRTVVAAGTAKTPAPYGHAAMKALFACTMTNPRERTCSGHPLAMYSCCPVSLCSLSVSANALLRPTIIVVGVLCI